MKIKNLITSLSFQSIKKINSTYTDKFLRGPELTPIDGPHVVQFLKAANPENSESDQRDALLKILSHRIQMLKNEDHDQQKSALLKILDERMELIKNEINDIKISGCDANQD